MPRHTPLIWNTRASYGMTPFKIHLIDYVEDDIPVKDITKVNQVIVIGTTINNFIDTNGVAFYFPYVLYHLQHTDVFILCTQNYLQIHGGNSLVYGFKFEFFSRPHHYDYIDNQNGYLSVVHNSQLTSIYIYIYMDCNSNIPWPIRG